METAIRDALTTQTADTSLGQLIKVIRENNLSIVVDKLIEFSSGKEEELRDVAGLGVQSATQPRRLTLLNFCRSAFKTVVSELPSDGKLAGAVSQKMVPKLFAQLQNVRLHFMC